MLKVLFVLKTFSFLSLLFGYVEKRIKKAIRKLSLGSEFMTSQTGQQIIRIHILPNIWRIKSNQIMKLGQLIAYNMRNIFLEKLYSGEASPRIFYKNSKLSISMDQQSEML